MARRRTLHLVAAAALAVLLAGCAGIPSSGGVHEGDVIASDDSPEIDIIARGPDKGATQEEILSGFVDAAASPQDRYAVARQYLTSDFSEKWDPDAAATIDDGADRSYLTTAAKAATLSITPTAEIDASGDFKEVESSASITLPYEFEKVGGQWRISKAPQGIILDQPTFGLVFGSYPVYFFDPTFSYLVPDLRWFPRRTSTPTSIVRALLAGPSEWLKGAVVSAFADGTKLASDSVQVIARDAQVDFNSEALQTDLITLQRMKLQLTASLTTVTSVSGVSISTDQIDQEIPDLTTNIPVKDPHVDSRALVYRDGVFGFLGSSGETLATISGISDTVAALKPTAATLGTGQTSAAVLSSAGVSLVRTGQDPVLLDARSDLIAPALDNFGLVWSVPADQPKALRVFEPDGTSTPVATSWPDASKIISIDVSRDGTRLIALVESGDSVKFYATSIQRGETDDRHIPSALGDPLTLATVDGTPRDVAWVDELDVASLVTLPNGDSQIVTQELGGASGAIEGTADARGMAGGNSVRDLRLLDSDGALELRRGVGWQERIDKVTFLGTQQGL